MGTFDTALTEDNVSLSISRLEDALTSQRAALAEQKERLGRLKEAAGQEMARCSGLEQEAERLSREQTAARQQLEAVCREGSDLQTALARGLAEAGRQASEQGRQLDQAIGQAQLTYDKNAERQRDALTLAERYGQERDSRRERADRLDAEQQDSLARLSESLRQAEEQAAGNISQALSRYENARIEHEAADSRLHLAQTSLNDIANWLTETESQLAERESALLALEEERAAARAALERSHAEAADEVSRQRAEKEQELRERQDGFRRVRALSELAAAALNESGSHLEQLSENLRRLYAQAEAETSKASQQMSDAIRQVLSRREQHNGILAEAARLEEDYAAAQSREADLKEQLLLLRTENQDLSSAAVVANDLALEAQNACRGAGPELLPTLKEMEESLVASAREAQSQARAKAAELREAEDRQEDNEREMERLRSASAKVRQRLQDAESGCLNAEDSMLRLSGQIGRLVAGRSESFDRIKDARAEFEAAGQEQRTLKAAANAAAGDLRQAQLEEGRLRHSLLQLEQKAARIDGEHQQALNRLADSFKIRLAEAASLLSISQDKQNRLLLNQQQKQSELEQAAVLREQAGQREQELRDELAACRARENQITEELRAQIARQKEEGGQSLLLAQRETEEAASRLSGAQEEINALKAALERSQAEINSLSASRDAVDAGLRQRRQELQDGFERSMAELEQRRAACAEQLSSATVQLELTRQNADFARKRAAAHRAGSDAAALTIGSLGRSIDADTGRLVELRRKEARLQAEAEAEARRQQEREAAIQRLREAQAKQEAEANARRLAELQAAAHAAAQAEQERLAREKAEQIARFDAEAEQMAAGGRLEREQLLELVEQGGLQERVQRIRELAAAEADAEDYLSLTDAQIAEVRDNAEFYSQQAAADAQAFASCRSVLASLQEKRERLEKQRRALAPQLAAALSRQEKNEREFDNIQGASNRLQPAFGSDDEVGQALSEAGSVLERARKANRRQSAILEAQLAELQTAADGLDQQLAGTRAQYEETVSMLEDVTGKWLYKESAAAAARAKLAGIERTAGQREEYRRAQQEAAAARSQSHAANRNLRATGWHRRKRI